MNSRGLAAAIALSCVLLHVSPAAAENDATLLRVFLRDGTSLVSYGEFARVADRVIFSLPTSPLPNPLLQLVNLPAGRIDWERTNRYADAARAARYTATQAEADYVVLSNAVARTLDNVARTTDPIQRLAIVESARKTLAEWPQTHFYYRVTDVHQMLSMLDEAIADLRAAAGGSRFEFSLTAVSAPPVAGEPLLPAPSPVESIDQLILAATVTDAAGERQALLNLALTGLNKADASFPANWASTTRAKVKLALDAEVRIDRSYQAVIRQALAQADTRARFADVRGIQRVIESLRQSDAALGSRRPDVVEAAIAAVEQRLDAARRLRLARDAWSLRAPVLQQYAATMADPLWILHTLEPHLTDIKDLAGSSPSSLALVQRQAARAIKLMEQIVPPEECETAHALLMSAAHLADNAASIRKSAAVAGDMTRAWDASSAAAGALMLGAKARKDLQSAVNRPQLQ